MINNRQAGRRRGRNNPRQNGGGNRGNGDSGNRIDNRARGNAAQLLEKYRNMARDAQMAGDRVNSEYYLQFADHYFRVLADNRSRQEEHQQRFQRNDEPVGDYDTGDEGYESGDDGDEQGEGQSVGNGRDRDAQQGRRNEGRGDGNRNDGNRGEGREGREGRGDEGRERNRGQDRGQDRERSRDNRRDDRRPRFANDAAANDESEVEGTISLSVLPPSIGRIEEEAPEAPAAEEAPAKPRRGRRPRPAEAAE